MNTVAWCDAMDAEGKRDAMGYSFSSWKVAVRMPDGKAARDTHGRQVFQTQAESKAQQQRPVPTGQTLSLF